MADPPPKRIKLTRNGADIKTVQIRRGLSKTDIHEVMAEAMHLALTATFELQIDGVTVPKVFDDLKENSTYTVIPFEVAYSFGLLPAETKAFEMPELEQFKAGTLLGVKSFENLLLECITSHVQLFLFLFCFGVICSDQTLK